MHQRQDRAEGPQARSAPRDSESRTSTMPWDGISALGNVVQRSVAQHRSPAWDQLATDNVGVAPWFAPVIHDVVDVFLNAHYRQFGTNQVGPLLMLVRLSMVKATRRVPMPRSLGDSQSRPGGHVHQVQGGAIVTGISPGGAGASRSRHHGSSRSTPVEGRGPQAWPSRSSSVSSYQGLMTSAGHALPYRHRPASSWIRRSTGRRVARPRASAGGLDGSRDSRCAHRRRSAVCWSSR